MQNVLRSTCSRRLCEPNALNPRTEAQDARTSVHEGDDDNDALGDDHVDEAEGGAMDMHGKDDAGADAGIETDASMSEENGHLDVHHEDANDEASATAIAHQEYDLIDLMLGIAGAGLLCATACLLHSVQHRMRAICFGKSRTS